MHNDIDWATKNNASICDNLRKSPITPRSFPWVSGLSSVPETTSPSYKPEGGWSRTAEEMITHFAESGHPVFKGTGPLARGALKSEAGGKVSVHFHMYGPVAHWCNSQQVQATELRVEPQSKLMLCDPISNLTSSIVLLWICVVLPCDH